MRNIMVNGKYSYRIVVDYPLITEQYRVDEGIEKKLKSCPSEKIRKEYTDSNGQYIKLNLPGVGIVKIYK